MFSYIKRHWPVYVILTLIAIALGFGAAYIVGAKGSTPASAISEEVEQEQSTGADGIPESSRQSLMVDLRLQSRYGDLYD